MSDGVKFQVCAAATKNARQASPSRGFRTQGL